MKISQRVIELWPAQDFTTMGDNSRTQSELSFLYETGLLNVLYLMVKYHANTLKGLELWAAQDLTTMGGNSKTESTRVVFFVHDTPTQCPLYIGEV